MPDNHPPITPGDQPSVPLPASMDEASAPPSEQIRRRLLDDLAAADAADAPDVADALASLLSDDLDAPINSEPSGETPG